AETIHGSSAKRARMAASLIELTMSRARCTDPSPRGPASTMNSSRTSALTNAACSAHLGWSRIERPRTQDGPCSLITAKYDILAPDPSSDGGTRSSQGGGQIGLPEQEGGVSGSE